MSEQPNTRTEILRMTANGRTPREIAFALDVSVQNVYAHLRRASVRPAPRLVPTKEAS